MSAGDGRPVVERRPPEWMGFYIDPEAPADGRGTIWRQTGTYWAPDVITPAEALRKLLPARYGQPLWAFAHAKGHADGAWYDLHYPEGVERRTQPAERALGPHLWVPADAR